MKSVGVAGLVFACIFAGVSAEAESLFPGQKKHRAAALRAHVEHKAKAEESKATEPIDIPDVASLATVPAAADIGANGFPQLPAVSVMLSTANEQMKSMNAEASVLEASMAREHQENEAKVAQQKHSYEKKLKTQELKNLATIKFNANISADIDRLEAENDALRNATKNMRDTNTVMRSQLQALKGRLGVARNFVSAALTSTEETKAEASSVVQLLSGKAMEEKKEKTVAHEKSHVQAKTSEDDEEDDDDDDDDVPANVSVGKPALSLLALGRTVHHGKADTTVDTDIEDDDDNATKPANMRPKDLLAVLQKGVQSLTEEEARSETSMKQMFLKDFKVGTSRHAALIAQQKKLNATQHALVALQGELTVAKHHSEDTNSHLKERLSGIGSFLQRLSHLAMAPAAEAPRLLTDLPKTVIVAN